MAKYEVSLHHANLFNQNFFVLISLAAMFQLNRAPFLGKLNFENHSASLFSLFVSLFSLFPPSSPPSPHYPPRARMTHSPPPRCLVTQSHFRVRDNVDSRARGRDGGGATGLLSGGCEGEAEPVPACRFLIGRLLDPAPQEEGPDSIKDTCSPLQRSLS